MDTKKSIASIIVTAALAGGGTYTLDQAQINQLEAEVDAQHQAKHEILKENIYLNVRLGEIPEWDIDAVSGEEMTAAYAAKANEEGATDTPNLWDGLRSKAEQKKEACVVI